MASELTLEERAFPLRPVPDPNARFKGTYRVAGWRRCGAMAADDGVVFTPWPHDDYPNWSLPALEATKCVELQGDRAVDDRLHLALFEAFFTKSRNIARPDEVARIVEAAGADMARFRADYEAGAGREPVLRDYRTAVEDDGIQGIPTVIVPGSGERVVGLADLDTYRAAVERGGPTAQDPHTPFKEIG
jgi:predicted DsbA family dithiol-disulfide isomerase